MNTKILDRLRAALIAAVALLIGLQLSWWAWHFVAPPLSRLDAMGNESVPVGLGRTLFGDAMSTGMSATGPTGEAASAGNAIRLKGVFAVDGKTLSAAVVNLGGRDQTVYLKQSINAATKLVEVQADYIVVENAGVREKIALDRIGTKNTVDANKSGPSGPAPTSFRLDVANTGANAYTLSRQELNTVLQDPRQLNFLGRIGPAPTGGVRVEDAPAGSLAHKLGLQVGDIIVGINGQPVGSQGDLVRVYGQFDSLGAIRADIRRNGTPVSVSYTIKN